MLCTLCLGENTMICPVILENVVLFFSELNTI